MTPGCVLLGHGLQALVIAVREVCAGAAVAVDLHQAGDNSSAVQINGIGRHILGQDGTEFAVDDLKSAIMELEIGAENSRISVNHW